MSAPSLVTHRGGCHCGAVQFEVEAPPRLVVQDCNCSICRMSGYWHLIVPAVRFRLLQGESALQRYTSTPEPRSTCSAAPAASSRSTCRARTRTGSA